MHSLQLPGLCAPDRPSSEPLIVFHTSLFGCVHVYSLCVPHVLLCVPRPCMQMPYLLTPEAKSFILHGEAAMQQQKQLSAAAMQVGLCWVWGVQVLHSKVAAEQSTQAVACPSHKQCALPLCSSCSTVRPCVPEVLLSNPGRRFQHRPCPPAIPFTQPASP